MKLTIGFSPCPNDTFLFDALINKKIDNQDFIFESYLEDVEKLNHWAKEGKLDITKISFSNYPAVSSEYVILNAGSALGSGCGPLLISKNEYNSEDVDKLSIAIPGKLTTANLLLSIFFPGANQKTEMLFSDIENAVLNNESDAGLIIHENRFTYAAKGLRKIADMGDLWEKATGKPIPLGCIVIRRSLGTEVHKFVNQLIKSSIQKGFDHPDDAMPYVRKHSQEMEENVMKQHIALYVNNFSLDLGPEGKGAIEILFKKGMECGLLPAVHPPVFIN